MDYPICAFKAGSSSFFLLLSPLQTRKAVYYGVILIDVRLLLINDLSECFCRLTSCIILAFFFARKRGKAKRVVDTCLAVISNTNIFSGFFHAMLQRELIRVVTATTGHYLSSRTSFAPRTPFAWKKKKKEGNASCASHRHLMPFSRRQNYALSRFFRCQQFVSSDLLSSSTKKVRLLSRNGNNYTSSIAHV